MGWIPTEVTLELLRNGRAFPIKLDVQELYEALVKDGDQGTDPPPGSGIAKSRSLRRRF
jgi:hypothetical protein